MGNPGIPAWSSWSGSHSHGVTRGHLVVPSLPSIQAQTTPSSAGRGFLGRNPPIPAGKGTYQGWGAEQGQGSLHLAGSGTEIKGNKSKVRGIFSGGVPRDHPRGERHIWDRVLVQCPQGWVPSWGSVSPGVCHTDPAVSPRFCP